MKGYSLFDCGMIQMDTLGPLVRIFHYSVNKFDYTIEFFEDSPPLGISFPFIKGLGQYFVAIKHTQDYKPENESQKDILVKLVKLEIENDSLHVGPPINVVSLYKDGHKWYSPQY